VILHRRSLASLVADFLYELNVENIFLKNNFVKNIF